MEYIWRTANQITQGVSECVSCGALVHNTTAHDRFHNDLTRSTP